MPVLPEMAPNQSGNSTVVPALCLIYYDLSSPCSLGHKRKVAVGSHSPMALWGRCDDVRLCLYLV